MPPSPPVSDSESDFYCDPCGEGWYEQEPMCESRLPSTIHELHRPRPIANPPVSLPPPTVPPAPAVENASVIPMEPVEPMLSSTAVSDAAPATTSKGKFFSK